MLNSNVETIDLHAKHTAVDTHSISSYEVNNNNSNETESVRSLY